MKLRRLLSIAALAASACTPAVADISAQERRLLEIQAAHAPLALSGDGAWRLHVDARGVLHRVSVADPTRESTAPLPPGVQLLSASSDGLKVALATRRQCVGLADFGVPDGASAKVAWRPWVVDSGGVPLGPETAGWVAQMPPACGDGPFATPVAISSDGKLIASGDSVVDSATNRVVASLPTHGVHVLRLQFVDHDTRLLIATAALGGAADPRRLDFSVWDLAGKTLVNHVELTGARLATTASLQVDFSPQTGALFHIEERPREGAAGDAAPAMPLDLVAFAPGACGAAPRRRAPLAGDDLGASFAVDPYGRWFASSRPLVAARDAADMATGARWALVVRDMATGLPLERIVSRAALNGLVATPDGATLFALAAQPVEPETGEAIAGWPAVPDGEQVLELKLPDAATTGARDAAKAWDRGFCKESGEAPGARAMARSEHPLKPLWSRDLGAGAGATRGPGAQTAACEWGTHEPTLFKTSEGGLWLDLSTQVAKLDPLTGALALGLPTPRTKKVCSAVTPSGSGFINAGGDTLTWRPLAAATDPARRRVIERRPGWSASLMPARDDSVRVAWSAPARDLVVVADYDSNGKRLGEFTTTAAGADGNAQGDGGVDGDARQPSAPCHDRRGAPLAIGYDWRAGPFGSQRGVTCGPLPGTARLVWWSGATIAPRLDDPAPAPRAAPAIDGPIAVVADDRTLHVVDLALQREFAQVDLAQGTNGRTWVLAARRLVLVESTAADGHRWLRAYALP